MSTSKSRARSFGSLQAQSRSPLRNAVGVDGVQHGLPASGSGHGQAPSFDAYQTEARLRRQSSSRRNGSSSASRSSAARPILTSRPVLLWTHEPPNFSKEELVMNPELIAAFGGVSDGSELLEVTLAAPSVFTNPFGGTGGADKRPFAHRNNAQLARHAPVSAAPNAVAEDELRKRRRDRGIARRSFLFKASQAVGDMECIERSASQLQLSISRNIASIFGFYNRCEIILSKVSLADNTISHIELYFRDQYLGRADQWRLVSLLEDTCVHVGQRVTLSGCVRATIGRIFIKEKKVMSGYVGPQTRAIFRSESAKYNVFLQMAQEMWDFDEDGEIYYEKALSGFLPDLVKRWRSANTTHVVSICLFARVFYGEAEMHMLQEAGLPLLREKGGKERWYIDYYKVIVDLESDCDWSNAFTLLKEEFFRFRHDVLLLRRPVSGPSSAPGLEEKHADLMRHDRALLAGTLSASHEGNILEAINLALNPFDEHYIDRDLNRTGLDLLILSAGTGHFDVDKRLLRLTTERLIDSGIGFDLVCLTKMPLHSVPLFHFESVVPTAETSQSAQQSGRRRNRERPGVPASAPPDPLYIDEKVSSSIEKQKKQVVTSAGTADFYSIPHWVDCSFYNLQQDKPFRADRFVPRCKMHEIQMLGLMENEISDITIPYIDFARLPGVRAVGQGAGRNGSLSGSLLPSFSTSNSGRFSKQTFILTESFGDSSGLTKQEHRRFLREQYDQEVFRDLEDIPSVYRPWLASNASELNTSQVLSTSPSAARSGQALSMLWTPATDRRNRSIDYERNTVVSPSPSAARFGKAGRASRDLIATSPALASHVEHPDGAEDLVSEVKDKERRRHQQDPESSNASPITPLSPAGKLSRPSSIYSIGAFSRAVRPLEPMGKAKPHVAPSEVDIAMSGEEIRGEKGIQPKTQAPGESKAAQLMRKASTSGSAPTTPKSKSGYSWLWSSIKRGATAPGQNAQVASLKDEEHQKSLSQTSSRVQALLGNEYTDRKQVKIESEALNGSSMHLSMTPTAPSPIEIPTYSGELSKANADESEAVRQSSTEELRQALEEEEAKRRYASEAQVEKQTLVNPCNPKKSIESIPTSQLMRWQHAFPRRLNQHVVKWRSMTTPACLPLTTVYLPSEMDLKSQWQEYPYQMSVSSDMSSFLVKRASSTPPALAVLREMAAQRLAQGFQFIVPATASNPQRPFASTLSEAEPKKFRLQEPWELFQPGSLASGNPIYLSMTNQIHRILYDRASNCINVKRFVRRTEYDTTPVDYACCIWARNLPGYQTVAARFQYPDAAGYNWTYLDGLIAGHSEEEELGDTTRYWRTRFVVVPTEGSPPPLQGPSGERLSDEEIRLVGMDRLADLFVRAKWRRRNASSSARSQPRHAPAPSAPLRFVPTSLDPALSLCDKDFMRQVEAVHEEDLRQGEGSRGHQKRDSSGVVSRLFRNLDEHGIVKQMYDKTHGLKINDRLWNRVMYRETFSGADFVTWLCMEFADVGSRNDATECGQRLLRDGALQHVYDYHGFIDGHYFYRVRPALVRALRDKDLAASAGTELTNDHNVGAASKKEQDHRRVSSTEEKSSHTTAKRSRRMLMSRSMIIDVDQGRRSDRAEVALLHHDLAHNPVNGFNFQIHWLGTTARFIEDLVQSWTRSVERYGLRLIEAPINQIKDVSQHNPFQVPLPISLALHPPPAAAFARLLPEHAVPQMHFEYALLRHFGFILDQEASAKYRDMSKEVIIEYRSRPNHFDYSQFVHRSGVAFVQVLPRNEGFLWLDNRLYNSHKTSHAVPHASQAPSLASTARQNPSQSSERDNHRSVVSADVIRSEFISFCASADRLEAFYRMELDRLAAATAASSPFS